MRDDTFLAAVRRFVRVNRFRPYVVQLVTGEEIVVRHPEALTVRDDGLALFFTAAGAYHQFDADAVCQVFRLPSPLRTDH